MSLLKRIRYSFINIILKIIIYPLVRLIWIDKVEGKRNIPLSGGAILVSNHESYFDFICLSAISNRPIHFMAGEVFFKKSLWRNIMLATEQIKIDRYGPAKQESAERAIKNAVDIIKRGELFGIYPEGTRSPNGNLQKAFTGVAKIILQTKALVIPIGMIGTYEIMSRHESRPHFRKCIIKVGQPIGIDYDLDATDNLAKQKITDLIMNKIAKLTGEQYIFTVE